MQLTSNYVVLYIDQFEELFTLTEDEGERQQFISIISNAVLESRGKLIVILSMRADFYGHPLNYPSLGKLIKDHNEAILPMTIPELRDAIEKPIQTANINVSFESGLVAEIIFALRDRGHALSGALPLLQFTLERLYNEREENLLTWKAYEHIGGIEGAIGTHSESVFRSLTKSVQSKLGKVFLLLINIDEDTGEITRRRASLESIVKDSDSQTLVNAMVENRLFQRGLE
jgi:hypothetical protein